jgi:thioredoxin reductase
VAQTWRSCWAITVTTGVEQADVYVVGAGPAGLSAAAELASHVDVVVLEREATAGGIPRHSHHTGFGVRDLHRLLTGPAYAERLVRRAERAGATIKTAATVTGWAADGGLQVTSPQGAFVARGRVVLLATGARERPRTARLVAGDRPDGVLTTGQLQNLVHLHHRRPGTAAVIVGAELVSWSAAMTLRAARCQPVLMTSVHARAESYSALRVVGGFALGTRVATRTRVLRVLGRDVVRGVELEHLDTGRRQLVECDTIVFTGDWTPDSELARLGGLVIDRDMLGPHVDTALRTSRPGVFAAGNLTHPVDTADVAAIDGRHAAEQVLRWLDGCRPSAQAVRLKAGVPFRWIFPGMLRPGDPPPPRGRLLLWPERPISAPRISMQQDNCETAAVTTPWPASPGRVFRVPSRLLSAIDPTRGDAVISAR